MSVAVQMKPPAPARIKPLAAADLEAFRALLPYQRWRADAPDVPPATIEQAQGMFAATQDPQAGCHLWLIEAENTFVGAIMMMPFFHASCRHLGYWVHPDYHGKGYASAAIKELSQLTFDKLGVVRLQAQVLPENVASIRVLEKNGFKQEALLALSDTKDGVPADAYLYGKIKENNK
jgi:ribosomal-protein-alanine N-acetyltransferase